MDSSKSCFCKIIFQAQQENRQSANSASNTPIRWEDKKFDSDNQNCDKIFGIC